MITEYYSENPVYIISVLCIADFYGEPLPPDKRYYKYVTSASTPCFSSLIDRAITFRSAERAAEWWNEHRDVLMSAVEAFGDPSTLKIRRREIRILEEDVLELK